MSDLEHRLDILSLEQCNEERVKLRQRITELEAENERLRENDERYRWLKGMEPEWGEFHAWDIGKHGWDAAIDAARGEE